MNSIDFNSTKKKKHLPMVDFVTPTDSRTKKKLSSFNKNLRQHLPVTANQPTHREQRPTQKASRAQLHALLRGIEREKEMNCIQTGITEQKENLQKNIIKQKNLHSNRNN